MKITRSQAVKLGLSGALSSYLLPTAFGGETNETPETVDAPETAETAEPAEVSEPAFSFSLSDIEENLVEIRTSGGGKSENWCGFIMMMQEQPYLITSQHALLGAEQLKFISPTGRSIKPRQVELSTSCDIARLALSEGTGFASAGKPAMDEQVAVFGGISVDDAESEIYGQVNGVGADIIEISAAFETGHCGCPVLNADREVLAMASYTRESRGHIMKVGTRFENRTRRFCRRLNDIEWQAVNWKKFNNAFGAPYLNCRTTLDDIAQILNSWAEGPLDVVEFEGKPQEKKLNAWLEQHNTIVSGAVDIGAGRREFYARYSDSAAELSKQCRTLSREIYKLSEQRGLTDFLVEEFEAYGAVFQTAADVIDRYGASTY